jgi:predicted  nucleic acid-binding Zn-ribbon protein
LQDQLELIKQLQAIDSAFRNLEKIKLEFPKKINQLEKEFEKKKQSLEKGKTFFEESKKEKHKKEQDLSRELERLQKSQDKLALVKTNKEYQAALKEIDDIKQHNSDIETDILLLMEKTDALAKKVKQEEGEYQKWFQEFEKKKETLNAELEKSNRELQNQQTLRNTILEKIDPDLIKKFEMIKERRQGIAVVSIQDGLCTGCNINIPPQKILEIRKSNHAIMQCPFCNRIVYCEEHKGGDTV